MNSNTSDGCKVVDPRGQVSSVGALHAVPTAVTYEEAFDQFSQVNNDDAEIDFRDDHVWRIKQICNKGKPTAKDLEFLDLYRWIHPSFLPEFNFGRGYHFSEAFTNIKEQAQDKSETKEPTFTEVANDIFRSREKIHIDNATPVLTELGIHIVNAAPLISELGIRDTSTSNSLSTSTYEVAQEIMREELVTLSYSQEPPQYPHAPKTAYPKAQSSQYSFNESYEARENEYGEYEEFLDKQKDTLSRCCYYAVNRYKKDWTVKLYNKLPISGYLSASVFIDRQPFTTTHEIEMLKLAIKSFLRASLIIKTDCYNDTTQAEVIFNGI